ncbi:putative reverse transcriptase domain-containing protein [Tanacetum coccineum]
MLLTLANVFQELALMCDRMFLEEIDQVEKYVGGLPDTIHGSVMATKPKTMLNAIEFATELMDKKINTWAKCQADNKRKSDDTAKNNQNQQSNKRQNTGRACDIGNGDRRPYRGPRPLCSKCNYHHDGPCAPKCHKCNRFGHLSRDCRNPPNVNTGANQRGNVCFECSAQGHFKRDCPKLKNNNNRDNRVGNAKAQAKVYAVGNAGANPDNNFVTGTFLLNNRYASILFDTGADRSFVSTAFSSRFVITPTALDHDYNVELADGANVGFITTISVVYVRLLKSSFQHYLMPCTNPALTLREAKFQRILAILQRRFLVRCVDGKEEKEQEPLRVRALVMTIGLDLPKQILKAQTEARKPENIKKEDVGGFWLPWLWRLKDSDHARVPTILNTLFSEYLTRFVPLEGLQVDDELHFFEEPVEIMDREVKQLRRSRVPIVKVRWNSRQGPEFTWEREDQFKKKYPHLFTKTAPSSSAMS